MQLKLVSPSGEVVQPAFQTDRIPSVGETIRISKGNGFPVQEFVVTGVPSSDIGPSYVGGSCLIVSLVVEPAAEAKKRKGPING